MLKERLQIVFDAPIGQCFVIAAKSISMEFFSSFLIRFVCTTFTFIYLQSFII